jgi:hypothetical protein
MPARRHTSLALLLPVVVAACGPASASPVPLAGSPVEMRALAGSWSGEYTGTESGRSGSIVFSLRSDADTAFGDVVMVPRRTNVTTPRDQSTSPSAVGGAADASNKPQTLGISFVRVAEGGVSGRLAPYRDPDLGVMVETVFVGRLVASDRLEGSFTTSGPNGITHHGRWRVTRDR